MLVIKLSWDSIEYLRFCVFICRASRRLRAWHFFMNACVCACKCMCFSPLDQRIKNSSCLFGLQCGACGWQKVNTKLIWALIFLMQTHSAPCVKVLSEVCTKFNKTSLCVICAQHLAKFNTHARVKCTHVRTHRYKRERTNSDARAHTSMHIVKLWSMLYAWMLWMSLKLLISTECRGAEGAVGSNWL